MRIGEYLKLHEVLCAEARELSQKKGHDYSGEEDTLRNLKATGAHGVVTNEQGVLVRMDDKMSRLWQLTKPGNVALVSDERIKDTILDGINYLCLLWALMEDDNA